MFRRAAKRNQETHRGAEQEREGKGRETAARKNGLLPIGSNPLIFLVPGARIELAQRQAPRDFKCIGYIGLTICHL